MSISPQGLEEKKEASRGRMTSLSFFSNKRGSIPEKEESARARAARARVASKEKEKMLKGGGTA